MKHILSIGILCLLAACSPKENQKTFVYEGNPLVRNNFTADPAALVHGDRLYLYVGHDEYYAGQDTASGGREFKAPLPGYFEKLLKDLRNGGSN